MMPFAFRLVSVWHQQGQLSEGQLSEEQLSELKLSEGSEGQLSEGSEGKMSKRLVYPTEPLQHRTRTTPIFVIVL